MSFNRRPKYKKVELDWVYNRVQNRIAQYQLPGEIVMDYLEEVELIICNYINRTYVPEPLRFVFVDLTIDLLKAQAINGNIQNDELSNISLGTLASVKDGDTELKFKTTSSVIGSDAESLLTNYTQQLDKYRLTKW